MRNTATDTTALSPLRRLAILAFATGVLCALLALTASAAGAAFGIETFDGEVVDEAGDPATQAGSHPFEVSTTINFNTTLDAQDQPIPDGSFKNIETLLPAGLVGDPHATPRCSTADFMAGPAFERGECSNSTAVGVAELNSTFIGLPNPLFAPVYNLAPDPGQSARFGFHVLTASIFLNVAVRTGGDYGLNIEIPGASQGLPITGTTLHLWGIPADSSHDPERGKCTTVVGPSGELCPSDAEHKPFLTNPTSCTGPVLTVARANSWEDPGTFSTASFLSHDNVGTPIGADGCDRLPFAPTFEAKARPGNAASPSSLAVKIHVPQHEGAGELVSSHLKQAVVTLPDGVAVNASSANGLAACSAGQIGIDNPNPVSCPDASKIGSARIVTPLLDDPLEGAIYLAKQGENPFGNLLTVYVVAEADGVLVKLPGKIDVDPGSGQVTTTFDNSPQLPFSDLEVAFFGGPAAVLTAPAACGTYTATGTFSPWSGTAPVTSSDSFDVTRGPDGAPCPSGNLEPRLSAGSTNPTGGRFSPFVLNLSRNDGTGLFSGVDAKLPKGLLAKLAGVPYCPDAALAAIPTAAGSGAAQLGALGCSAASQVGTVSVLAGSGPAPFFLGSGKVYLAGPYRDAPYSLALVTPAVAGPLDLGNVVVRAALRVDPRTAQVEVVTDPIPTLLAGIPLNLREIRVRIDRDQFTVNPTSCAPSAVDVTVSAPSGATAAASDRFQVGSCASLGLAPKLSLALAGSTQRGGYPKLRAVLKAKPGQANLRRVSVALPHSEFLAQNHIRTICTRAQFAADACPAASIYGHATAFSPLLDQPLQGPVYLRSSDNPLPDLVADLHGQIELEVAGRIDSVKGGLRDNLEGIPDAPVSKFVLTMKGGKRGLLRNSASLCRGRPGRATVQIDGQNGKTADQRPALKVSCGGRV